MPHQLKEIEIKEISFVTKGASGDDKHKPKILFWKGITMPDKPSFIDRLKSVFTKAEEGGRTPEQMLTDLKEQLTPEQQDILMLLLAAAKAASPEAATETPAPEPAAPEKAEDELPETEEMEKVLKDNPALADHLAKIADARKSDREEIAKLKDRTEKQEAKARRASFEKQVQEYTWLPGDHSEVAALFDEVDQKLSPESQETLAGVIRATDGIVRKSSGRLFGEKGTTRPGEIDGGGANGSAARLNEAATALQKQHEDKGEPITIEKATSIVLKKNRELRREIDQSRQ